MTWYANQIYAKPAADVVDAFRTQPFLADQLYHVDDLRGVRSEWTREMLLSPRPPRDRKHMRHGLPPGGLLVVSPEIYQSSFDRSDPGAGAFARHYRHNTLWANTPPRAKWEGIHAPEHAEPFFPKELDRKTFPVGLLRFLKWVYETTSSPVVYYQCGMWGGNVEHETAWIMDAQERVYELDNGNTTIEHTTVGRRAIDGDLLPLAMSSVGLELPTRFFALHEVSFHWRPYRIENSG